MFAQIRKHLFYLALALPITGLAEEPDWSYCSAPVVSKQAESPADQAMTEIMADRLFSENKYFLEFSGRVELTRGHQQLSAERIQLDKASGLLSANGNLSFDDQFFRLNADKIKLSESDNTGVFELTDFQLYQTHLRGSAKTIIQLDDNNRELYDVSYTTCDAQNNSWSLSAGKLKLDQQDGRGTAIHAVFRIKEIPIFYFPWFQFPIDNRRMSGILAPTITRSSTSGTEISLPIYWNQAENYDMTLTPVSYSRQGLQLNTENRYLFKQSSGQLNLSWLDDDITDTERWYRRWTHEADSSAGLHTSILIQKVSDSEFLEDFDHLDTVEEVDFLKSSISFSGQIANWSTQLLFEQHQTVNDEKTIASSPYKRLPRLSLERIFSAPDETVSIDWKNEWVRFDKEESITGDRLHMAPVFSYPLENSYSYVKPALQLDYTRYSLDNNIDDKNSLQRSLPLLSIDSGLIFERRAHSLKNWTQTLEPRFFYLYVPFEEQSEIPDFDSSLLPDSYQNLFVNNRFTGTDRIGDTRQLSVGVTTRLLDDSNKEFFSASIGQAYFYQDRKVSLTSTVDDREKSNVMTVASFKPAAQWNIQLASVYDQLERESAQTDISIRRRAGEQIFNAEYHRRLDDLEQTTFSVVYPMSVNWTVFAKRQHSLIHDKPVQNLFGLAYESCCWGFKALYEESTDNDFEETDRAVYLQLTFKGLSSAGQDINSLLKDGILGYQPLF